MKLTPPQLIAGVGVAGLLGLGAVGMVNAQTDDTVIDDTVIDDTVIVDTVIDDTGDEPGDEPETDSTPVDEPTTDSTPVDEPHGRRGPSGAGDRAGCDDDTDGGAGADETGALSPETDAATSDVAVADV